MAAMLFTLSGKSGFVFSQQTQAKGKRQMETVTVYNAPKTKTYQATVLGRHNGLTFVEHPTMGDGAPILIVKKDGTLKLTHAWDMASVYSGDY